MLTTAICVPYLLSFLTSLQTVLFSSSRDYPGFFVVIWVLFVEIGQSLGIVIFLFEVLPQTKNITGLFLMSTVCIVPSVLKVIFSSHRGMTRLKKFVNFILDILAILAQASVWIVFIFVENFDTKSAKKSNFELFLVISTVLISLGWWENFAQVRFTTNRVSFFIQNQINQLRKHNAKIYCLTNFVKIICTFVFSYFILGKNDQQNYWNFKKELNFNNNKELLLQADFPPQDFFFHNSTVYVPFVLHVLSTMICYFTGRTACKVLMQGLGFSIPLVFATPATVLILLILSLNNEPFSIYNGALQRYLYLEQVDSKLQLINI